MSTIISRNAGSDPGGLTPAQLRARQAPEMALRRLELTIVRKLDGFLHGEHLGILPGPGTELAEARLYRPGEDDVRRMDWAVTARTTEPHVRDVISDRELETWALVDLSGSMDFGTTDLEKRDLAIAAVATIGYLTMKMGDRFGGFVLRSGQMSRWPARSGRMALHAFLRSLFDTPRNTDGAVSDLTSAMEQMARANPRRGLRLVVSDFLDGVLTDDSQPLPWERAMKRLSLRHQVLAVTVSDPMEQAIPNVGVLLVTDPETGESREIDTGSRRTREQFTAVAAAHRERVSSTLRRCGAAHLELSTSRDWVMDIARFALTYRRVAGALHPTAPVESP
jgi:uncharacterized protein (DUF58 family)